LKRILILVIFVLGAISCGKDRNTIPNVLVDISVNINNPGYISLQVPGGYMYFSGGSRGIVCFRTSTEEFMAYDRHCPYEPENSCGILSVQSDNVTMKCGCCASTFSLYDGSLQSGPAINPVRRYSTSFDGSNLRIYN
jgi:nitrite reductase/ring-hydroxylating ferredoxin subunit